MELIISEKPSSAQKIAEALAEGKPTPKKKNGVTYYELTRDSKDIIVVPSVGHLFSLAPKKRGKIILDPVWKPTWQINKKADYSKKYYNTIKSLAKKSDTFTVATDLDVEGEVISLNIIRFLCNRKDARRMKFSTLTKIDLQKAYFSVSKTLDWGLANAGLTRHRLDFLFGVNLSKAVMSAVSSATDRFVLLSIGRVQGPSLALLAEREIQIKNFKPKTYWQIFADFKFGQAIHKEDKFWDESKAKQIFEKVKDKPAKIDDIQKRKQAVLPPFPFDLTSLQIEAYRCFGISPKQTLSLAQNLYSNALISYPRTSSQKLPIKLGFKNILNKLSKNTEYKDIVQQVLRTSLRPGEGRKTDSAHPAIHPTGELPKSLSQHEFRIYDLIVKRFFSVFGPPGTRESTNVFFNIEKESFILQGIKTVNLGWQAWYLPYSRKKEFELPNLKIGEVHNQKTTFEEKETQPPKRYTPASIIKALEKEGLGTKSTRANIIDILAQRGYIQGTPIQVTELGIKIVETFGKYAPDILSKQLTRKFEDDMEKIQTGSLNREQVIEHAKKFVTSLYKKFEQHQKEIGKSLADAFIKTKKEQDKLMTCLKCGKGDIRVIRSKKTGKSFAACSGYPDCKTTFPVLQSVTIYKTNKICKECDFPVLKIWRFKRRPYEMCLNHKCKTKENWKNSQHKNKTV